MSSADRIRLTFVDATRKRCTNLIYMPTDSTVELVQAYTELVQQVSVANVDIARQEITRVEPDGAAGGTGPYQTHADQVTFLMLDEAGIAHQIAFGAPKAAIFLADFETVNPAQADVIALTEWLIDNATSRSGIALASFVRGWRWRFTI